MVWKITKKKFRCQQILHAISESSYFYYMLLKKIKKSLKIRTSKMFLAQKFKVITLSKIEPNCSKRICFSLILCNLSEQCNTCICLPLINALLPKFDRKVDIQSGQKFQSSQTYFFSNSKVRTILCVFPLQSDF